MDESSRIRNTGLDRDVMVPYQGWVVGGGFFSNSLHLVEIGPYRNTTKTLPILNIWKNNITLSLKCVPVLCLGTAPGPIQTAATSFVN